MKYATSNLGSRFGALQYNIGRLHSPSALDQILGFSIGYNSRYNISYIGIYINYRGFFLKKVIEENSI